MAMLGELVDITGGGTPSRKTAEYWGGGIPWATVKDFKGFELKGALESITEEGLKNSASNLIPAGSIIVPTRMAVGKAAVSLVNIAINQDLKALLIKDPKKVDRDYLFRILLSKATYLESRGKGATVKGITLDVLRELEIPLPPLEEQKRIAAILDKADAIRRKRQQAIDLTDQLLRSVFLDMFGDPVTNPKGWDVVKLGAVGQLDRGKSKHRPRNDPILLGGYHPLIQTGDVAKSGGYIKRYKSTYSDIGLNQSRKWPAGTLCITIAANIANTGILEFDACFPDSVVGFTPNELVTVEYIQAWLGFLQKIIEDAAPESAQKNINLEILRNLEIPLASIKDQERFSQIVHHVKNSKGRLFRAELEIENLFSSLNQQAFRGELSKQTKAA